MTPIKLLLRQDKTFNMHASTAVDKFQPRPQRTGIA